MPAGGNACPVGQMLPFLIALFLFYFIDMYLLLFSHSVMSDSLQPHGL